jgi:DNA-binding MarR family transcriptional regulator
MPLLMLKDLPRFECLLKAAERYPSLDPRAFEVFLHLLRTGDAAFADVDEFLRKSETSQGRFTVLTLLDRTGEPLTPAELAEEASVTRATMTGLLDTLEKDQLVARAPDLTDRRTIKVTLTAKGAEFVARLLPEYCGLVSAIVAPLSDSERTHLVRLLQKIQRHLPAKEEAPKKEAVIAS